MRGSVIAVPLSPGPLSEDYMNLQTVLLVLLIILLLGALPTWPYSAGWGYYPSGRIGFGRDRTLDFCSSPDAGPFSKAPTSSEVSAITCLGGLRYLL